MRCATSAHKAIDKLLQHESFGLCLKQRDEREEHAMTNVQQSTFPDEIELFFSLSISTTIKGKKKKKSIQQ
ncbi:CLUMA_CG014521, isoform A [Clunio marinus]|uniref:CLUMA_CG014521, isoform A n=1 Tax=Clunio marinus TaxID=568069 RepID=A0A1J1IQR8_9DIPT|nr:CLUMA_CG014521, isoform A [Clunio marinus]